MKIEITSRGPARRSVGSIGRLRVLALAVVLVAAACSSTDDEAVEDTTAEETTAEEVTTEETTTEETTTEETTTEETTTEESAGETATGGTDIAAAAELDGLRNALGVQRLVMRNADGVSAASDNGVLRLTDQAPAVFRDFIVHEGQVLDYAGEVVCQEDDLPGGDFVIVNLLVGPEGPVAFMDDRSVLNNLEGTGSVGLPQWRVDCITGDVDEVPTATTVDFSPEITITTTATPGGLVLMTEQGIGDTPLRLTTGSGVVLLEADDLTFDFHLSSDEATLYATTYRGTAAAEPPNGIIAIDVATGEQRWRRDVGGFVWVLPQGLVIEEIELSDGPFDGLGPGRELVLVDPASGADLERFAVTDRVVAIF